MTVNDLPTVGYLDQWFRVLLAAQQGAPAAAPAEAETVLYTAASLAAVLSVDVNTVRRWIRVGKPSPHDPHNPAANVRLVAMQVNSEPRISWQALLAYERGEVFDKATTPAPRAVPPPPAALPAAAPAEAPRLRKAS